MTSTKRTIPVKPAFLIVPGLRDFVPEHWQTFLAAQLPNAITMPPLDKDRMKCGAQVAALDAVITRIEGPVIVIAHSAGVMTTVQWAKRYNRAIHGALLATPPDFETPMPDGHSSMDVLEKNGWLPVPKATLPFRSIVAASRSDPLATFDRVADLASRWGSSLVDLGKVGHLNPASGYGPWPDAVDLVAELICS
ncbi:MULTISPECIES: alpha/beta hydrolase [unclassified Variovorax]|uniref:RBBP9/YdeN family alpha/beta hydrolase n=1 Tax=unclassified Variovorax TaxID=663243 RepID=UPI000B81A770|nr:MULTISPECIES: alpha/beta hydrolase [unclassified Variovorax]